MPGDIVVRLKPLSSKNKKLSKSDNAIALDQNPTIIFKIFWQDRKKCSGTLLCGLSR